jgi:hypothetical protein
MVREGSRVQDVPGKSALALNDPNEKGVWQNMLADRLYVTHGMPTDGDTLAFPRLG